MIRSVRIRKIMKEEAAAGLALALTALALLSMLAGALHAAAETDIWVHTERVRPILLNYQNGTDAVTEVQIFNSDSGPQVAIRGRWYLLWGEYLCQSWGGWSAFAQDFPRVVVRVYDLDPALIYKEGYDQPLLNAFSYPAIALGHEGSDLILYATFRITPLTNETFYFTFDLILYNAALGKIAWMKSVANTTAFSLPMTVDIRPHFWTLTIANNATTVIYGYVVNVSTPDWSNVTWVAYENYWASAENLTLGDLRRFVDDLRGWYVWVGTGILYYLGERTVQNCYWSPSGWDVDENRSLFEYEVVESYPRIENWRTTPDRLWELYVSGALPNYRPPPENVQEIDWAGLYAAIIPALAGLGFGLGLKSLLREEAGPPAALGAALGLTLFLAWVYGWGPLELTVVVIFYGVAIWLST